MALVHLGAGPQTGINKNPSKLELQLELESGLPAQPRAEEAGPLDGISILKVAVVVAAIVLCFTLFSCLSLPHPHPYRRSPPPSKTRRLETKGTMLKMVRDEHVSASCLYLDREDRTKDRRRPSIAVFKFSESVLIENWNNEEGKWTTKRGFFAV